MDSYAVETRHPPEKEKKKQGSHKDEMDVKKVAMNLIQDDVTKEETYDLTCDEMPEEDRIDDLLPLGSPSEEGVQSAPVRMKEMTMKMYDRHFLGKTMNVFDLVEGVLLLYLLYLLHLSLLFHLLSSSCWLIERRHPAK